MEYRYIGRTGLRVSPICMGTMTFGTQLDKSEAFRILDKAYEHGVNFFDTAELYPAPEGEAGRSDGGDPLSDGMKVFGRKSSVV